jgi:hypothetical protein
MKVTILSPADYAGSGLKLFKAIKAHTDIDIEIYSDKVSYTTTKWGIEATPVLKDRKYVQDRILKSDVIHIKGDWPPTPVFMGMRLHDNIVTTTSGSTFRKRIHGGYETYPIDGWQIAKVKTSFEPDLLYPEYGNIWTPHPIDSVGKKIEWQYNKYLMHMPSNYTTKDTKFVRDVFDKLEKKGIRTYIATDIKHDALVQLKKKAGIYFDQFLVGFYGNAAIEAMQYGVPVANWISDLSISQGFKIDHPIITYEKNVNKWVDSIFELVNNKVKLQEISQATKTGATSKN